MPDLALVSDEVERLISGAPDGDHLDAATAALISFAVAASPTTLDRDGMRHHAQLALATEVAPGELTEAMILVSALGMHALHEGARVLAELMPSEGSPSPSALRMKLQADRYWQRLDEELPGFLEALDRLSPHALSAFVEYCALPWRTGTLPAKVKELIYLSIDATPSHRYLPGLRLHVRNALDLGAGRREIVETIGIAAEAGPARTVA